MGLLKHYDPYKEEPTPNTVEVAVVLSGGPRSRVAVFTPDTRIATWDAESIGIVFGVEHWSYDVTYIDLSTLKKHTANVDDVPYKPRADSTEIGGHVVVRRIAADGTPGPWTTVLSLDEVRRQEREERIKRELWDRRFDHFFKELEHNKDDIWRSIRGLIGAAAPAREDLFGPETNPFGGYLSDLFPVGGNPFDGPGVSGLFGPGGSSAGGGGPSGGSFNPVKNGGGGSGPFGGASSSAPFGDRPSADLGKGFGLDYGTNSNSTPATTTQTSGGTPSGGGTEKEGSRGSQENAGRGSGGPRPVLSSGGGTQGSGKKKTAVPGVDPTEGTDPEMPNPMGTPSGFTGDAFLDNLTMRALRSQGALLAGRSGPVQGLYGDTEHGGPGVMGGGIQRGVFDPVSLVAGGEHYEGRSPGNRRAGEYIDLSGRGVEALKGDNGNDEGRGNSTVAMVGKLTAGKGGRPKDPEGGSPHALGVLGARINASAAAEGGGKARS